MRLLELWQCSGVAAARRSNYAAIFYQFGHILGSSSGHWPRVSRVLISRNVWSGNCRQITQALELPLTAAEGWSLVHYLTSTPSSQENE